MPWTWWLKWSFITTIVVGLPATALRFLRTQERVADSMDHFSGAVVDETAKTLVQIGAVVFCILGGFWKPRLGAVQFQKAEQTFQSFARHRRQAILLAGLLPVVIRIALLPILPVPEPRVSDEFGHLLIADTFLSGRMTNPPHPMWRHFESLYVLQQPTHTAIYPFAQGLVLAAAKAVGCTPWIGVCLSVGVMCAAICWMLQGWLPPAWALLGALLAMTRFTFLSYWMNTYWGGAVPAIGGALVAGALPRVLRTHRLCHTMLMGLGLAILAQSRPFEGFLLSLPVAAALFTWILTTTRVSWNVRLTRILLPLCCAGAAILAITGFYNWRVTGNPLLLPYQLHQKIYGTPQSFFWANPVYDAPGLQRHKDIVDNYRWQLTAYLTQSSWKGLASSLVSKSNIFWTFYFQPLLTVPLLFLPLACKDRWTRFLVLTSAFVLFGIVFYPFFYFHYAAPICGMMLFALIQGMRRLRTYEWRGKPVGLAILRFTMVFVFASFLRSVGAGVLNPAALVTLSTERSRILDELKRQGGRHLVLVRYTAEHLFHISTVYNDANIDASPVVWARDLEGGNKGLLRYFAGRKVWLFEPDEFPPRFAPARAADLLGSPPDISAVLSGAGIATGSPAGIAPGEIVTIFGHNFARRLDGPLTLGSIFWPMPLQIDKITMQSGNVYTPMRAQAAGLVFSAPLPLELANARVQFGELWAPIYSIANIAGQESITVQAPFELRGESAPVKLWVGESAVTAAEVRILPAHPGIFQAQISDNDLSPVLLRPGGSFVASDNPARRGEIVKMLVTGLGPMVPPVATNQRAPVSHAARYPIQVAIDGAMARVISAKYVAGMIGVEEVAFEVPRDSATGAQISIVLAVNADGQWIYSDRASMPVF